MLLWVFASRIVRNPDSQRYPKSQLDALDEEFLWAFAQLSVPVF
jgi:hypothetical protein